MFCEGKKYIQDLSTNHLSNELEAGGKLHPKHMELLLIDEPLLKKKKKKEEGAINVTAWSF